MRSPIWYLLCFLMLATRYLKWAYLLDPVIFAYLVSLRCHVTSSQRPPSFSLPSPWNSASFLDRNFLTQNLTKELETMTAGLLGSVGFCDRSCSKQLCETLSDGGRGGRGREREGSYMIWLSRYQLSICKSWRNPCPKISELTFRPKLQTTGALSQAAKEISLTCFHQLTQVKLAKKRSSQKIFWNYESGWKI